MHPIWDDERTATLRKLWTEGQSASQIAKELGGVTRNAIIGKVYRLGLARRADPNAHQRRSNRAVRVVGPKPKPKPEPIPTLAQELRAIADLAPLAAFGGSGCAYMPGDPRHDTAICGRAVEGDSAWCCAHRKLVYQPDDGNRKAKRIARMWTRYAPFADRYMVSAR